jgi:histone-lysine N-methyltransferase SETMAR
MGINDHYDPYNKRQSMEYCHKGSPAPNKYKTKASSEKVMLIVFWNSEGVVLTDFLQNGATVNSEHYIETLRNLKKRITRKEAENDDILLQQDNARPHASAATTDAIACLGLTVLQHPVYSPDLAPNNFHLFPKLKDDLRGQNFSSDQEVKAAVHQWFWEKEKDFFKNGIQKLVECWQKCIGVGGDYVEKRTCTVVNKVNVTFIFLFYLNIF